MSAGLQPPLADIEDRSVLHLVPVHACEANYKIFHSCGRSVGDFS